MKSLKLSLIGLILSSSFVASADGSESGGGGGGILCANSRYQQPMSLLEIYEAKRGLLPFVEPLKFSNNNVNTATDAINRLEEINPYFANDVRLAFEHIFNRPGQGPISRPGFRVRPPSDTVQPLIEEGCRLVGLGEYIDSYETDRLFIDPEYISMLPPVEKEAFKTHEAIYFVLRKYETADNSLETRIINATLYSDQKLQKLSAKPTGAKNSYYCHRERRLDSAQYWTASSEEKFYIHDLGNFYELVPLTVGSWDAHGTDDNRRFNFIFRGSVRVTDADVDKEGTGLAKRFKMNVKSRWTARKLAVHIVDIAPVKSGRDTVNLQVELEFLHDGDSGYTGSNLRNVSPDPVTCEKY